MAYQEGQIVYVVPLRRNALVARVLSDKFVQVSIGALSLKVATTDLRLVEQKNSTKRRAKAPAEKLQLSATPSKRPPATLDLHGQRTAEACRLVEDLVDRAVLAGYDRLEIIHGIGTGRVKQAVHELLHRLTVVQSFKSDDRNPGVTWVYL